MVFTGERRPDVRGGVSLQEGVKESERDHGLFHRLFHALGQIASPLSRGREVVEDVALAREDQVHGALHARGVNAPELGDAERRSRLELFEEVRVNLPRSRVAELRPRDNGSRFKARSGVSGAHSCEALGAGFCCDHLQRGA